MSQSPFVPNYAAQWWLAVISGIVLVAIGAIQAVGPDQLGIPVVAFRWLGIVVAVLSAAQSFLPKVSAPPIANYDEVKRAEILGTPGDPLIESIQALTPEQRVELRVMVERTRRPWLPAPTGKG